MTVSLLTLRRHFCPSSLCRVPESPYWLVSNGRIQQAENVVQKMAHYNRVKVKGQLLPGSKDELLQNVDHKKNGRDADGIADDEVHSWAGHYKGPGKESIHDLFTDLELFKHLIITMGHW